MRTSIKTSLAATFVFAATSVSCMEQARAEGSPTGASSYIVRDYANDGYVINHPDGTRSVVTRDYSKGQDAWRIRHPNGERAPYQPKRTTTDELK